MGTGGAAAQTRLVLWGWQFSLTARMHPAAQAGLPAPQMWRAAGTSWWRQRRSSCWRCLRRWWKYWWRYQA
jgi:hypothetical protein